MADPVWKETKMYGEDVGNAAFSQVTGAKKVLPPGYKMTVLDIDVGSDMPVGHQDFFVVLVDGDGTTVLQEYGPIRFWVDGFEHVVPAGLVFSGGKDNQDRNYSVELWAVEDTGAVVPRNGTVLYRIEQES